jgi:hypothetical protein
MKKKINASLTTRARNKNTHPDDIRKQLTKHTQASNAAEYEESTSPRYHAEQETASEQACKTETH